MNRMTPLVREARPGRRPLLNWIFSAIFTVGMRVASKSTLATFLLPLMLAASCSQPAPQPPDQIIIIRTFYKTGAGVDLLDSSNGGSFKKGDIKIISKVEIDGTVRDVNYYEEEPLGIFLDGQSGSYYIELVLPTNYAKTPVMTLVTLRPSLTDTVTYTYNLQNRYVPNQIFYNRDLVWDIVNAPVQEGLWPPITIVK